MSTTNRIDPQIREALVIVTISFLLPVTAVAITVVVTSIYTLNDFLTKIIPTWHFPLLTAIFWVGGPLLIRNELLKIKQAGLSGNFAVMHTKYRRILLIYVVLSILYSTVAGVIPLIAGFEFTEVLLSTAIAILYLGINYMPFYIVFLKRLDKIYELFECPIESKSSLTVKFKFRFTAICSSVSGVLLIMLSALILIWRFMEFQEFDLDFSSILTRLAIVALTVISLQSLPNLFLSNVMIGDIESIKNYVTDLASHRLNSKLTIDTRDDFGIAGKEIQTMGSELSNIINSIAESANYLLNASKEFNKLSGIMSEGSSGLAASAEELASSIEEMSANISLTSENAEKSAELSSNSTDRIKIGQDAVQNTVKDIKEIANKIDLVQKIASQTNLLAVNASIEASAAREHGKGFGVIAREVRELADKSNLAADQITSLAEATMLRSKELKEEIDDIAENSSNNTVMANNIASASKEQQRSSDQVNSTVQSLNDSAQQLAASAEELSSSSHLLADRATYLQGLVQDFEF